MNIAVDIGNTRLKRGIFSPGENCEVANLPVPIEIDAEPFLRRLLWWESAGKMLTTDIHPEPIIWQVAPIGSFSWNMLKVAVLDARPHDQFNIITRQHIPLAVDVDFPEKVGIDRLLAAFAATEKYGDSPMLVVDAGSAVTVDVVRDRTFCGGAILPGLAALSATYPKISTNLPLVPIPDSPSKTSPIYPGKNTNDAIYSGLYWGTIGAIRQFYGMLRESNPLLILTGGDAEYLLPGLAKEIAAPQLNSHLVLEGIHGCGFR